MYIEAEGTFGPAQSDETKKIVKLKVYMATEDGVVNAAEAYNISKGKAD